MHRSPGGERAVRGAKAVGDVAGLAGSVTEEGRSVVDAHLRPPEKVSTDDRLVGYETLLVAKFLDILQGLHGGDFRQVVRTQMACQRSISSLYDVDVRMIKIEMV